MAVTLASRFRPGSSRLHAPLMVALVALSSVASAPAAGDDVSDARSRGRQMLKSIRSEVTRRYYTPDFAGRDLKGAFERAEQLIADAGSEGQIGAILAQALLELQDSHTFFIPPARPFDVEYGFEMRMIGESCRIISVVPGTDAEAQGLTPGLAVLKIEGSPLDRVRFRTSQYALEVVRPRSEVALLVQSGSTQARELTVKARITPRRKTVDLLEWFDEISSRRRGDEPTWRFAKIGKGVTVVRVSRFDRSDEVFEELMRKVHDSTALIVDLRGNPGGSIDTLRLLLGAFFEDDVEIGTLRGRKGVKPLRTRKPDNERLFEGPVLVLVDQASASSSELFARVVQLEGRGKVLGDRSAGAVRQAELVSLTAGHALRFVLYGVSVSTSAILMRDGKSLEGNGVVPDELLLPSEEDLRAGRDPVLSKAASLFGVALAPAQAGGLFRASEPQQ